MKHHKISKLLNDSTVSKFVTRKWIEMSYLSGIQYSINLVNILFYWQGLYCYVYISIFIFLYIVVKGAITIGDINDVTKINKKC